MNDIKAQVFDLIAQEEKRQNETIELIASENFVSDDVKKAVDMAQTADIDNINADLIFAVPGQKVRDWEESLINTVELGVKHISAYSLIFEEGTPEEIFEHPKKEKTRTFIRQIKRLELRIDTFDFDYTETIAKIERYAGMVRMDAVARRNLLLTFDEIFMENLIIMLRQDPLVLPILISAEYSEKEKMLSVEYTWNGERFNPIEEGDELSMLILSKLTKNIRYRYDGRNHIVAALM